MSYAKYNRLRKRLQRKSLKNEKNVTFTRMRDKNARREYIINLIRKNG